MKRFFVIAILLCLLLCGCASGDALDAQPTPTLQPTDTLTTSTPVPTPTAAPETVTVYLLESTVYYDSGSVQYHYDDDYNVDSYASYTLENELMYTAYFEEKDSNGMACRIRSEWQGGGDETRIAVYDAHGKLQEERYEGDSFSGYQFAYDQKGNLTEKREYYDGILQSAVYFEYDGEILRAVYGEDREGNRVFDCVVEQGRIMEKICYDSEGGSYSYFYEYDANGCLIRSSMLYYGEQIPGDSYTYITAQVDAHRADFLGEQQRYLIPIV